MRQHTTTMMMSASMPRRLPCATQDGSAGAWGDIGNFVEVKKSSVRSGTKVNPLSYIGDADHRAGEGLALLGATRPV